MSAILTIYTDADQKPESLVRLVLMNDGNVTTIRLTRSEWSRLLQTRVTVDVESVEHRSNNLTPVA